MSRNNLMKTIFSVLLLSGVFIRLSAQMPSIKVEGKESNLVYLQKLDVAVRIHGAVATTTWTMTFKNNTGRTLEGELNFPLAEGISVSRYALDINGKLREAVPVEKEKGTMVFENIERRRADPGLLEKVAGNGFRTRIYPILPNGVRTVLIGYDEELVPDRSSALRWRLPLAFTQPLEVFNLQVQIFRGSIKPVIEENIDGAFQFSQWEDSWSASHQWQHFKADRSLTVLLPKSPDGTEVMMQAAGNHYLYLLSAWPSSKKIAKPQPHRITLLWDASLSGSHRDHIKEFKLLDAYFSQLREVEVSLVRFSYKVQSAQGFTVHEGQWRMLRDSLEHTIYDGGTQFGAIHPDEYTCDEYLLFSDGRSNFGSDQAGAAHKPLYAVVATAGSDYPFLRDLSERSGGELINLEAGTIEEAKTQLLYQSLVFMGVRSAAGLEESYPSVPTPIVRGIMVAGISYQPVHQVLLQFGYGGKVYSESNVNLDFSRQQVGAIDLGRIWAQKKIAQLDRRYEDNKAEIDALGKHYGIVTRNTSLIVLEAVEDYVMYGIEPPAELREEYDRLIKARGQEDRQRQQTTMENAERFFDELLGWWKTAHREKSLPEAVVTGAVEQRLVGSTGVVRSMQGYTSPRIVADAETNKIDGDVSRALPGNGVAAAPDMIADEKDKNISVGKPAGSSGNFKAFEHEIQSAYLSRLRKAPAGEQYAVYLQERKLQFYTPLFYFNTAHFFFKQGRTALGLQILSNIAELDVESYELYKMLGYELRRLGESSAACTAFKKVLEWRPFEPQSFRDYGLALADAGFYQRALDTLYTALTKNYDEHVSALYPGIEETILPEINNLVAFKGDKINFSRIPKRLLMNMPVDIRVVLNWNMNDTDIDLWVTDPNGEKCYYSHRETALGGRISSDFTRGFGPEQFLLKKAVKGRYKVEVNYFGDTQTKLAGATTVLVEIFTHYGSSGQTRKLIPMQLQSVNEKTVLVGEFSFE